MTFDSIFRRFNRRKVRFSIPIVHYLLGVGGGIIKSFKVRFARCYYYLSRARSESVCAHTLESSLKVHARPVAARVHVDFAFVLVHALLPRRIQNVTDRTFAPVRPVGVDALASIARVRHEIAFVQVFALVAATDALRAQFGERVCKIGRPLIIARTSVTLFVLVKFASTESYRFRASDKPHRVCPNRHPTNNNTLSR